MTSLVFILADSPPAALDGFLVGAWGLWAWALVIASVMGFCLTAVYLRHWLRP